MIAGEQMARVLATGKVPKLMAKSSYLDDNVKVAGMYLRV